MQTDSLPRRAGVAQVIDELDLGELGRAIWRKKRWIIGLTLAAAAIAFVAVNLITPRYKSEARVLIETRENIFLRPEAERTTERTTTVDQEAVTSQVQLILSRDLARTIIHKLQLGKLPEFDPLLRGGSIVRTILILAGFVRDPARQTPEERVLKSYFERLTAFQVEKSRVIAIEFESEDPALAARVTNAIAASYLMLQQAAKQEQSRAAGQWLAGEIERLRKSVAEAEAKVEAYRSKSNLFVGNNNTTLSNQQLGDFNAQLAGARAQKADAESKAKIIRDALRRGAPVEISDIVNSELLRRLSEQYVTLRAQLAEQSSTLLDRHPRIKELRAQIAGLERQMRSEADRLARSLENDARVVGARVEALSASLDQLKRQAASTNEQDVQLRALEREAKSQRDLLESYLAKYREATARNSIGAASPDARIISRAIVSNTPSWPKKLPTILIAALGMFTISVGFVVTGQLLGSARIIPVATVEPVEAAALPGTVPATASAPDPSSEATTQPAAESRLASRLRKLFGRRAPAASEATSPDDFHADEPAASAPFAVEPVETRPVRASSLEASPVEPAPARPAPTPPAPPRSVPVLNSLRAAAGVPLEAVEGLARALGSAGESARRIAVMGERRNMGTTLAAITLARVLARQGKVVLVDLALGSPNLSVIASDPTAPGIAELVRGTASFGQIITRDRYSRMHVITAGRDTARAAAIMSSHRLPITLEALARSYDYVVVDAGALPEISAERFAELAPRAVLVADDIEGPATEAARERLLAAGFPNVSVLANGPHDPESDTGGSRAAA